MWLDKPSGEGNGSSSSSNQALQSPPHELRSKTLNSNSANLVRSVQQWRHLASIPHIPDRLGSPPERELQYAAKTKMHNGAGGGGGLANHSITLDVTRSGSLSNGSSSGEEQSEKSRRKKKLIRERQQKARETHREALHNTRATITLVAILIATFTYNAGVSPPGGVHQDGHLIGTAVAAPKVAFRVFSVCNNVALFTSICIVLVMVSIIPFRRRALLSMLSIAHKAIWVAASFMATAYAAAAVVLMPPQRGRKGFHWTTVFVLSICGGSLGTVFVGLGIMWVKHRLMKRKWRKQNPRRRRRQHSTKKRVEEYIQQKTEHVAETFGLPPAEQSTRQERDDSSDDKDNVNDNYNYNDDDYASSLDSDMASSRERGYHTY